MQYQDHFCKFTVLSPLMTKRAPKVAAELIKVLSHRPPHILQSDNGKGFVNSILNELKILWPTVMIINGRARHPETQSFFERVCLLFSGHLTIANITNTEVDNIRLAVKKLSTFGGRGFVRCSCTAGCKSCKCKCYKNKLAYNSRCNPGRSCKNDVQLGEGENAE